MAGQSDNNQNADDVLTALFPQQQTSEILLPRLKQIDFSPLKWGCVSVSIQNGHVAWVEVKESTRAD
jgi:hypothetical protein